MVLNLCYKEILKEEEFLSLVVEGENRSSVLFHRGLHVDRHEYLVVVNQEEVDLGGSGYEGSCALWSNK